MKKIAHIISFPFSLLLVTMVDPVFSQSVGIGGSTFIPKGSAMLEVRSSNKGILIPKIALTGTNDVLTIPPPLNNSLLIYNSSSVSGVNAVSPGFYYRDSINAVWRKFLTSGNSSSAWLTGGNTNGSEMKIGTADNYDIPFITNNVERARITKTGNIGIGTSTPNTTLDVQTSGIMPAYIRAKSNGSGDAGIFIDKAVASNTNYFAFQTNSVEQWWICTMNDNKLKIRNAQPGGGIVLTIDTLEKVSIGDIPNDNKFYVYQVGTAGTGYGDQTVNAIFGSGGGNSFSFGVTGYAQNSATESGGVHGANLAGNWGALGYYDNSGVSFGGYFNGNVYVNGQLTSSIATGTSPLNVTSTTQNSNLNADLLDGYHAFTAPISNKTANYTLTTGDYTVIFKGTGLTATLPTASGCSGRIYIIVNQGATALTISSYQNLADSPTTSLPGSSSIMIQSNGTNWYQLR